MSGPFPEGEPEGEAPEVGYCEKCGVEMAVPNDMSAWPEACPNGHSPVTINVVTRKPNRPYDLRIMLPPE